MILVQFNYFIGIIQLNYITGVKKMELLIFFVGLFATDLFLIAKGY